MVEDKMTGIPGVGKGMLEKLKKEDAELVMGHFKKAMKVIKRKQDFMDGKIEELGERTFRPKDEIEQISTIIKEVEKAVDSELLSMLLATEVDCRQLVESIDEEQKLLGELEEKKAIKLKEVVKELEGEAVLGLVVEHQLNLLRDIKELTKEIINRASKLKDEKIKDMIGSNMENVNDIASYFSQLILHEELPQLSLAYNLLKLEEWPEVERKIADIKSRFVELEPKLL